MATAMHSGENEIVTFPEDAPCVCDGPVESWLQNVVDSMQESLKEEFRVVGCVGVHLTHTHTHTHIHTQVHTCTHARTHTLLFSLPKHIHMYTCILTYTHAHTAAGHCCI